MSGHLLRRRQIVPGDLETVFAFFESPRNLEEITPRWLRFQVVRASEETMRLGTEIDYRLRWQGMPMRWRSRIAEHEPPRAFADEMLVGPYRGWYHRHLFSPAEGGVEMIDVVAYSLPLGPLGRLAHAWIVRAQLEAIFDYRRAAIAARFGESRAEGAPVAGGRSA